MDISGFLWTLLKFGGPVVLLAVIAWAILRNRTSPVPKSVSEAGARQVRREEEAARRSGTDGEE